MVQLTDGEVRTREVLEWRGIHLLHAPMSSCSQKVRIALALKRLPWHSHVVDVLGKENLHPWYLGINPRGLVPTLVLDGAVHIESNDILLVLERAFPERPLVTPEDAGRIPDLLRHEDELHLDLRTLSFRFLIRPDGPPKSDAELSAYQADGAGTVGGRPDTAKAREVAFWRQFHEGGLSDDAVRRSAARFRAALDELDQALVERPFLLGDEFGVLDIAWLVYANRLRLCGYPLRRLHPRVGAWFDRLVAMPEVAAELTLAPGTGEAPASTRADAQSAARTLEQVCGL